MNYCLLGLFSELTFNKGLFTWCLAANKFERCRNVNYGRRERNPGCISLRQHAFVCVFGLVAFFGVCFSLHSFKVQ